MKIYLFISIILYTFAKGIDGGHVPLTRELPTSPFPFSQVGFIKKLDNMTKKKTILEVKRDFKRKWGNVYDYSYIYEYNGNKSKLPIRCRKHNFFYMSANEHLRGHGCPHCRDERTSERCRMSLKEFVRRSTAIHNGKYSYKLITEELYNLGGDLPIICPIHGVIKQKAKNHLTGRGCYRCGKQSMANKQRHTRDELVTLFNKQFDGKYDYSLFKDEDYKRKKDYIKVICPKHGTFTVSVDNHLYKKSGCPHCKRSFGEEKIANYLDKLGIQHKEQYRLTNEYILCKNKILMVDFFLPSHNAIIEYNGIQHYKETLLFDERNLDEQQERDNAVRQYCKDHKIKLIEIPYTEYDNIENILKKELKL